MSRVGRNPPGGPQELNDLQWPDPLSGPDPLSADVPVDERVQPLVRVEEEERRAIARRLQGDAFEPARPLPVVLTPTRVGGVDWEELNRYLEAQQPQAPELLAQHEVLPPPQALPDTGGRASRRGVAGLIDWIKELLGARPSVRRDDGVQPVLAREQLRHVPQAWRVYSSPEFLRDPYSRAESFDARPTLAHEWSVRFGNVAPNPVGFHYPVPADPIPLPRDSAQEPAENTFRASSLMYAHIKA